MTLEHRRYVIAVLGGLFLVSLLLVQWLETVRRAEVAGLREPRIAVPAASKECVECHGKNNPGIIAQWRGSAHAVRGIGCVDCHQAKEHEVDAYLHHRVHIATVVTPLDCARCHEAEGSEFAVSHHAKSADLLASLETTLAETIEGARLSFAAHSPTPGMAVEAVDGLATSRVGCRSCHGSQVAFRAVDGGMISVDELAPDETVRATNPAALERIVRDEDGRPLLHPATWPNTGIGRVNLDGSRGSCSACHGRHDFSSSRARQPENCGKCHLGPEHAQKEIYAESKHGVAYANLRAEMRIDADSWVLGEDYATAPTCSTCHLSGNQRNDGKITHDPARRISWTHRPTVSLVLDTNAEGEVVLDADAELRDLVTVDPAADKRYRMKEVCTHCHTLEYVNSFYRQYDDLVILYNEKFAKPGRAIMETLSADLLSATPFDEEIEWIWYDLWHEQGRRARHGAAMMGPEYTHRHGMRDVAQSFYMELIPRALEIADRASRGGQRDQANRVRATVEEILARPEHRWLEEGVETASVRAEEASR